MKTEILKIQGMHCGHCAAMVKRSLEMTEGVTFVDVKTGSATVVYDENIATHDNVEAAITRFGYKLLV